jgi:hypothetical protein
MRGRKDWEERGVLMPVWGPVEVPYMLKGVDEGGGHVGKRKQESRGGRERIDWERERERGRKKPK